jgi:hypothetical protein
MSCRCFRSRRDLLLENLALRQQLAIFKQRKQRPRLFWLDKVFWVGMKRIWSEWKNCLVLVSPETVVRWHRAGFRSYWHWRSRHENGCSRRRISRELRELIFQMVAENPTWGAPRIHGELQKLGFDLSERTVSRWMRRVPRRPDTSRRWQAFLSNHREASQPSPTAVRYEYGACFSSIWGPTSSWPAGSENRKQLVSGSRHGIGPTEEDVRGAEDEPVRCSLLITRLRFRASSVPC